MGRHGITRGGEAREDEVDKLLRTCLRLQTMPPLWISLPLSSPWACRVEWFDSMGNSLGFAPKLSPEPPPIHQPPSHLPSPSTLPSPPPLTSSSSPLPSSASPHSSSDAPPPLSSSTPTLLCSVQWVYEIAEFSGHHPEFGLRSQAQHDGAVEQG
jgi:hypothetical protein